jgi:hypothetical protein
MKMKLPLALVAILAAAKLSAAVTISDFGTPFSNGTLVGDWSTTFTSDATTTTFTTGTVNGGDFIEILPLGDLTGLTQFEVTAKVDAGNAAPSFTISVFTTGSDFISATFATNQFTGSYTTVTATFSQTGTFDPLSILGWGISGGEPSGSTNFRMSFDSIVASSPVAVPEPSTYASLAGVAALGFVAYRRRRVAA